MSDDEATVFEDGPGWGVTTILHLGHWGPVVSTLVCDRCGNRPVGSVRRWRDGSLWLATTERTRRSLFARGERVPPSATRLADVWLVEPLSMGGRKTVCRRHGWLPVPPLDPDTLPRVVRLSA